MGYARRKEILEKVHLQHWVPVKYDETATFSYLIVRSPAEYAVLETIFKEIKRQDPGFSPKTMFDFGSGIGTGYWAAKNVFGKFSEVFCVDKSTEMNDVARNLILRGNENTPLPMGMSFRLHCPSTISLKYSLVVCAYTLMEMESSVKRMEVVQTLWDRLEEGGCLVLAELGTNAGFQIICEARDYLLQVGGMEEDETKRADIIAPCPHTKPCPRYTTDTIPCNFKIKYRRFDLKFFEKASFQSELYSYIVIKKGKKSRASLPRLVEEPLKTKNNFYCRLCTQAGTLQEVVCSKRHVPELYQLSKFLHWGDEMPVKLDYTPVHHFAKLREQPVLNPDKSTYASKYLFKEDSTEEEDDGLGHK